MTSKGFLALFGGKDKTVKALIDSLSGTGEVSKCYLKRQDGGVKAVGILWNRDVISKVLCSDRFTATDQQVEGIYQEVNTFLNISSPQQQSEEAPKMSNQANKMPLTERLSTLLTGKAKQISELQEENKTLKNKIEQLRQELDAKTETLANIESLIDSPAEE